MAIFATPEFWVLVSFLILVALAAKPVYRGIGGALDKRAAKIKAELDEAHTLREEAQKLLADYQRRQRDAAKEAEAIVAHAQEEAERIRRQAAQDLEAAIARREKLAEEKIAQAEAAALKEVRNQAIDVAVAATARLLAEKVDQTKAEALVDEAIKGLPENLH